MSTDTEELSVTMLEKEENSWIKTLLIKREGQEYIARLSYTQDWGYELTFFGKDGKSIPMPEWAEAYNAGEWSDLNYDLDELSEA